MLARDSLCSITDLENFLSLNLSDDEQARVEAHLDDCLSCRQEVERLAASPESWQTARESLRIDGSIQTAASESPVDSQKPCDSPSSPESLRVFVQSYLTSSDDPEYIGRIAAYDVVGIIGYGAMSIVLKAFEKPLNRYVAVKILSPVFSAQASSSKRFAREARAAAAVLHENVISIHGISEWNGLPYLVMPYVGGESLQKRLDDNGPLGLLEILRVGHQIAAGLSAAHAQGLIHRDIKPSNILLERNIDRLLITDFGLAQAADDARLTQSGIVAGTPQYMSPEQACGEPIDHRSDLFSLGSLLYALGTGHAPFRAETAFGVMRRIVDDAPRNIREVNPDIPEWLCCIIQKLHARSPNGRFESAEQIAKLFSQCLAHAQQPSVHQLPRTVLALTEKQSTKRSYRSVTAAVSGLAFVLTVCWLIFNGPFGQNMTDIPAPAVLTSPGENATEKINQVRYGFPSAERLAYLITMSVSLPDGDAQLQGLATVSADLIAEHQYRLHVAGNLELTQTIDHRDLLRGGIATRRSANGRRHWNGRIRGKATISDVGDLIDFEPQLALPFQLGTIPELIFPRLPSGLTPIPATNGAEPVSISSEPVISENVASDLDSQTFRTSNSEITLDAESDIVASVSTTQTLTIETENITQRIPVEIVVTRLSEEERNEWEQSNSAEYQQRSEPLDAEEEVIALSDLKAGRRVMHWLHNLNRKPPNSLSSNVVAALDELSNHETPALRVLASRILKRIPTNVKDTAQSIE